ncbi:MAG: hypothetical protein FXF49_02885 [Flexistipes sinusarabici]|uniref:Tetrapyrrole methylase domain-containing protein n=1 Tax=Flexistipes sinusarabici TaxID=2352 RepID=A0A5D0MSI1_FLESI|nr:SAM-dependent methyltransferase [Flexistipes sinusarabici]TYB34119.1 MAG: hypothetical protein FXF49_02885 [Flexistipes sinusarabici]
MGPRLCVAGMPLSVGFDSIDEGLQSIIQKSEIIIAEEKKTAHRVLARSGCRGRDFFLLNEHSGLKDKRFLVDKVSSAGLSCFFSDQGTPCVADPGYDFVDMCYAQGIDVFSFPGPSSITTALSLSGFYAEKFYFAGFPPRERPSRIKFFDKVFSCEDTVVLFERPYVMKKLVDELVVFKRRIAVVYNLGMRDEKVIRGYPKEIAGKLKNMPKAPFVVILEGIK